jgi:isoquinoline 1-oxidoreductase subunit alpha
MRLRVNGKEYTAEGVEEATPLLWVLRDNLGLVGTKYGCGIGACGACTVLLNGQAVRSCLIPVASAADQAIITIEGLAPSDEALHPLQRAWINQDVAQCGYCQGGQLITAVALLAKNPDPSICEFARPCDLQPQSFAKDRGHERVAPLRILGGSRAPRAHSGGRGA